MRLRTLLTGAAAAATFVSGQANALTFNLMPTGAGTAAGTQARRGFEIAANYWSSVLTDSVTMNLQIGFSTLGTNILGSTGSARASFSMNQLYGALASDVSSTLDATGLAALPVLGASAVNIATGPAGAVTAVTNGFANGTTAANGYTTTSSRTDSDGSFNNSLVSITKANAKALGLTANYNNVAVNYATSDASITFSDAYTFDFDPTDGIAAGTIDFISVAIHEIGHALGFVSGVDSYDGRTAPGSTTGLTSLENSAVASVLDLYRYSADSNGVLDWRTGGTSYLSLDRGTTQLFGDSRFSTGVANGDGRQASHWKDSAAGLPQLGIMDPTAARGQLGEVTALDLAAFDLTGWNVNFDVQTNSSYRFTTAQAYQAFYANGPVPELATWAMMIGGFGVVGASMRRRRASARFA